MTPRPSGPHCANETMPNVPDWTDVLPQPPRKVDGYRNVEMAGVLLRVAERYDLTDYN